MKKSDLKTGMWVEYEDGEMACVLINSVHGDILTDGKRWIALEQLKDDMSHPLECCNVVKVYKPTTMTSLISRECLNLIWQREEIIEMTIEEACKKLREVTGKPIKITI